MHGGPSLYFLWGGDGGTEGRGKATKRRKSNSKQPEKKLGNSMRGKGMKTPTGSKGRAAELGGGGGAHKPVQPGLQLPQQTPKPGDLHLLHTPTAAITDPTVGTP